MPRIKISAEPTSDASITPKCFGAKVLENKCMKCIWYERCLYESYKKEIQIFKEKNIDIYKEIKDKFLNSNLLDSLD
jgi:hypothetical protein